MFPNTSHKVNDEGTIMPRDTRERMRQPPSTNSSKSHRPTPKALVDRSHAFRNALPCRFAAYTHPSTMHLLSLPLLTMKLSVLNAVPVVGQPALLLFGSDTVSLI